MDVEWKSEEETSVCEACQNVAQSPPRQLLLALIRGSMCVNMLCLNTDFPAISNLSFNFQVLGFN